MTNSCDVLREGKMIDSRKTEILREFWSDKQMIFNRARLRMLEGSSTRPSTVEEYVEKAVDYCLRVCDKQHEEFKCVMCGSDDELDPLDYTQDRDYRVCGLCLNSARDGDSLYKEHQKTNCVPRDSLRVLRDKLNIKLEKRLSKLSKRVLRDRINRIFYDELSLEAETLAGDIVNRLFAELGVSE